MVTLNLMAGPTDYWQVFLPTRRIQPTNDQLVIPVFSVPAVPGLSVTLASLIFARFTLNLTSNFTLMRVKTPPTTNFIMAVSYSGARYKLWGGIGEVLTYPTYKGETLPANAVLECWTVNQATKTITNTAFNLSMGLTTSAAVCTTEVITSRNPATQTYYPN